MAMALPSAGLTAHRAAHSKLAPSLGQASIARHSSRACSHTCPTLVPWTRPHQPLLTQNKQHPRPQHQSGTRDVATAAATLTASTAAAAATGDWSQILAVLLGYAVLVGSCFRSVPQIVKVIRNQSCEGLSLTSNAVELVCFTIMVAYNMNHGYAFNTYGEIFACWLQDILLVAMILRHNGVSGSQMAASTAAFAALCGVLFWPGLCPPTLLATLQLSTLFIMAVGSRVPQILLNMRRGNAGVMSLTTCLLNVAGNVIRTFTTLVLTHDKLLLLGCITQGCLNTIILVQVIQTKRQQALEARNKRVTQAQATAEQPGLPGSISEPEPQFLPQLA